MKEELEIENDFFIIEELLANMIDEKEINSDSEYESAIKIKDHLYEKFPIIEADTIINPRAMMVHI